jgi:hypothetical protein
MARPPKDNMTAFGRKLTALEKPKVINRMIVVLAVFCGLLFVGDFFHLRHGKFAIEDLIGFYALFGFAAFAFIIFATKWLKKILGRKQNYYAPDVVDAEDYPDLELDVKEYGDV